MSESEKKMCSLLSTVGRSVGFLAASLLLAGAASCAHRVKVEPVEVKPIHMTIDVNIKVERELDEFFDFEEEIENNIEGAKEGAEFRIESGERGKGGF